MTHKNSRLSSFWQGNPDDKSDMKVLLEPLGDLDWSNVSTVAKTTEPILKTLGESIDDLIQAIITLPTKQRLWSLSDHEIAVGFTKFVLYDDPAGRFRIRFHYFWPDTPPQIPHSHRAPFSSLLLHGSYIQTLYNFVDATGDVIPDLSKLSTIYSHSYNVGDQYTIQHSATHGTIVRGEPCCSLAIRGPVAKRRAIAANLDTKSLWTQFSSADQTKPSDFEAMFRPLNQDDIELAVAMLGKRAMSS